MASAAWADLIKAAEDAGFSLIPNATYDVKVAAAEAKTTAKGKDMISLKYEITTGPHAGRKVSNNFVISPESPVALGFFFREMKAMGLDHAYFGANPAMNAVAANLVGKTCRIELGTKMWNGEERNEVVKVLAPAGGVAPSPMAAVAPQPQPVAQPAPTVVKVPAQAAPADLAPPVLPY
jgi:hypothetical protein